MDQLDCAHRYREDDFRVAGQVSNVAVEGHALLRCTGLAHSQGDTQDGVSTKLSCGGTGTNILTRYLLSRPRQ